MPYRRRNSSATSAQALPCARNVDESWRCSCLRLRIVFATAASFRRGSALDALGMPLNRTVTAYRLVRNLPVKPGEPVSEDHGFSGWLAACLCQKVEVDRRRLPGEIVNLPLRIVLPLARRHP